jgi:hypothetical protein
MEDDTLAGGLLDDVARTAIRPASGATLTASGRPRTFAAPLA